MQKKKIKVEDRPDKVAKAQQEIEAVLQKYGLLLKPTLIFMENPASAIIAKGNTNNSGILLPGQEGTAPIGIEEMLDPIGDKIGK